LFQNRNELSIFLISYSNTTPPISTPKYSISIKNRKILPPWFVHGFSMVPPSKTPKSMDKPWTNHGGTMEEPWTNPLSNLWKSLLK
jgi:hypothetical protein